MLLSLHVIFAFYYQRYLKQKDLYIACHVRELIYQDRTIVKRSVKYIAMNYMFFFLETNVDYNYLSFQIFD